MVIHPTVVILFLLTICTWMCQPRNVPYSVNTGQDIDELSMKKDSMNTVIHERHKRQSGAAGYDCKDNNPCTPENRLANRYVFKHITKEMFIQCNDGGKCLVKPCPQGLVWDADARTCNYVSDKDECVQNPCLNGGECQNTYTDTLYTCICHPGYTGANCDLDVDECVENPCLNSGQCQNMLGSYTCSCAHGFTGTNCDSGGYDCEDNNPCTTANRLDNHYLFPHLTKERFIQCDVGGQCQVTPCPQGLVWDVDRSACIYMPDQN